MLNIKDFWYTKYIKKIFYGSKMALRSDSFREIKKSKNNLYYRNMINKKSTTDQDLESNMFTKIGENY